MSGETIFDRLAPEQLAVIPAGAKGVMDIRTTREIRRDLEKISRGSFEKLCKILFEGENGVSNFHATAGSDKPLSKDMLSKSIIDSMERLGLVKDGQLVNPNK